jgi:6-phosphogluconolactonase/glucosamine-6-phosphate isomerase/deaminase
MNTIDLPFAQATVHTFTDQQEFWSYVIGQSIAAVDKVDNPHIAASGGSAAGVFAHMPFGVMQESTVWLTDERFVPSNHTHSNAHLLHAALRTVPEYKFFDTSTTRKAAIEQYNTLLQERLQQQNYLFDLTYLGVGPDGHFASLFPNSPALRVNNALVTTSETNVFNIQERLTLTIPAIIDSKKILVLMIGSAKSDVFTKMTNEDTNTTAIPARMLIDWPNVEVCWLNA